MHAITIAARNYLAMARTVAASFSAHNPGSQFTILVVDGEPGEVPTTATYDIATPHELSLSPSEFGRMAFLYDVTELSTALKPWALEMLLDRGAEVAVYLDPDIYVYDSLEPVEVEAMEHGIVLTPHTLTPMPRDGLRPTEADIMGAGIYNLGFIAVSKTQREMLTWWQQRLRRDSISAPEQMLFTDQRWIDMVPGYFDHRILRDPGYNVAYWNLDSRPVSKQDGRYLVDGVPLRFFHFSGYQPDRPWVLSRYVDDRPRVVLSEHPAVRELCDAYAEAVRRNGQERAADTAYRFNRFLDGTPIVPGLRRMYRQAVIESEEQATEPPPAPFTETDDGPILDWFRERVVATSWVTRAAYALWLSRVDLKDAFPDVFGADRAAYLAWCLSSGVQEKSLVASLLPAEAPAAGIEASTATEIPGVNLVGYFRAETGVGQIGRLLVDAVRATGLPYSTRDAGPTVSRRQADFEESTSELLYPINLISVNADQFPIWASELGADLLADRYTIGVWAWEVESFPPDFDRALALVDEVWAISSFGQTAIQQRTSKAVHVIPYQIPHLSVSTPLNRSSLGLPDRPYFLFMFDYLSVFARKNPLGAVEAFIQAFPAELPDGPVLVIKSVNGGRFRSQREQLRHACSSRNDIYLIEDYLEYAQVEALVADCLAYVSLHRAEGLGLTMSEAMSAGKPVIATRYSGNLDFMDIENSLLVPARLVPISAGAEPYGPPTRWAEPDIGAAAEAMRWVVEHPEAAAELGASARESVRGIFDLDRSAAFVTGRVEAIIASRNTPNPADVPSLQPAPVETVEAKSDDLAELIQQRQELLNQVPDVTTPTRYPLLAPLVRRAIRRVLSHHDEHMNIRLNALLDTTRLLAQRQEEFGTALADQVTAKEVDVNRSLETIESQFHVLEASTAITKARSDTQSARVDRLDAHVREQAARLQSLAEAGAECAARVDTLAGLAAEGNAFVQAHQRQLDEVSERLNLLQLELAKLDAEIEAQPYQSDRDALRLIGDNGRTLLGYRLEGAGSSSGYADFEDVFRGDEQFIEGRLTSYVELVREHQPVLDIGCGRGEFVHLLQANSIEVSGIDSDPSMVRRAQSADLKVELGDGIHALKAARPGEIGSVTSFQVIEHLELPTLRELFVASFAALEPGGVLIAETVNPHSMPALKTFWLDLTHIRPLFPESLLFLAREAGFTQAEIHFPQGSDSLRTNLRECGEYALVARKGE